MLSTITILSIKTRGASEAIFTQHLPSGEVEGEISALYLMNESTVLILQQHMAHIYGGDNQAIDIEIDDDSTIFNVLKFTVRFSIPEDHYLTRDDYNFILGGIISDSAMVEVSFRDTTDELIISINREDDDYLSKTIISETLLASISTFNILVRADAWSRTELIMGG